MKKYNKLKREKLFKLFSDNFEWVKELNSFQLEPNLTNVYVCPICLNIFLETDLNTTLPIHLTLEDIPPASLGGKPLVLTCNECNSRSGSGLDKHLLNILLENDFSSCFPHAEIRASFELNGNIVNGMVKIDKERKISIISNSKSSNPKNLIDFSKAINPSGILQNNFSDFNNPFKQTFGKPHETKILIKPHKKTETRRAEIALLRIGYLLAFATFGNSFLLNNGLGKIREQILNPDKNIMPKVFWIKYEFSKEFEGVNIITSPKELQSFLIIFSLSTKSCNRQYSIVIPGPYDTELKIYDFLSTLSIGDGSKFLEVKTEKIPTYNYLKNKSTAFAPLIFWQKYINKL